MNIVVAGGGIAGLTLASALTLDGHDVRVFEAAKAFSPIGAGINLLPHAVRVLDRYGMAGALESRACSIQELRFFEGGGREIHREPRGLAAGSAWPQLAIRRADLHECLAQAFPGEIVMDARLVGYEPLGRGVRALFSTGGRPTAVECDLLVGCDGIHSTVRRQMFPEERPPIPSGVMMWRGTTRGPAFLDGRTMVLAGALRTGKLVAYPVETARRAHDEVAINWLIELRTGEEAPDAARWDAEGDRERLYAAAGRIRLPFLDPLDLVRGTSRILHYAMVDRDPLPTWSDGSVTLLGDAAHPMYPFGSNGAGQAILDTWALRNALRGRRSASQAVRAYEDARREATAQVVLLNRTCPPDHILELVDQRRQDRRTKGANPVVERAEVEAISQRYRAVAGFAAEHLQLPLDAPPGEAIKPDAA